MMRFAYADPPYFGLCDRYDHHHEAPYGCWDEVETHKALIANMLAEFDGWAMSLHTPTLRTILPLCPPETRVAAWVKPFASFKPGVNPGYCWEPVIFWGGRRRTDKTELTVRDYYAEGIQLRKGFHGAKPPNVCRWITQLLGYRPGTDEFVDLFPGSGVMERTLAQGAFL